MTSVSRMKSWVAGFLVIAMGCSTPQLEKASIKQRESEVLAHYKKLSAAEHISSKEELEELVSFYESLGAVFPAEFKQQVASVVAIQMGMMEVDFRDPIDCSGDPVDAVAYFAKMAEKAALAQFPISAEKEEEYGDDVHDNEISEIFSFIEEGPQYNKLVSFLEELLPYRERMDIDYDIHLIDDDDMPNAFAILGGHIYVTTGMLEFVDSDDELVVIIGHEIGHVDDKHCVTRIQKLAIASELAGEELGTILAGIEAQIAAPFGQVDEYAADRIGARFAYEAGYDPRMSKDFFSKLEVNENYDLIEKLTRTHPYSAQRKECLEDYIRNELGL